jgi:hypothetical protein
MEKKPDKLPSLAEELRPLLEEVVRRRNPQLAALVLSGDIGRLTIRDWADIRLSLGAELCETGLDQHEEPNLRGYQIEDLIDWIGRRMRWAEESAG